jgi:ABC-type branched-subunit amino acid transport system substrate-binding protein
MKNPKRNSLLVSLMLLANSLSAAQLTESEAHGKQIYTTGESPSGKAIQARVGLEATELLSTQVPCVSCHGEDGQGRPEGNIVPTNITFEYLTLSYGHQHDNGRKHPAFTIDTFIKAISTGVDSAGNRLDYAMPRYTLSDSDSADLIAYLKRLSSDVDAGLTDTTIRLATILPTQGALAEMGQAMKAVLLAYFDEINAQGGIYNRKIQLDFIEYTDDDATLKNVHHLLETQAIFALITPFPAFSGNVEQDIVLLTEKLGIPQIAPYTLFPEDKPSRSQFTFYLLAGLNNEARAMVDYVTNELKLKNIHALVISPENSEIRKVAKTIEKQSQTRSLGAVTHFIYSPDTFQAKNVTEQLTRQTPEVIFFFGAGEELGVLLESSKTLKTKPYIFISSSVTSYKFFNTDNADKVFLSVLASSHIQNNAEDFFRLIKQHNLSPKRLAAPVFAYSAAKLLVEGLQKTGRELSRKKLVQSIEHIYEFDTGLLPPLTYGTNRHIGTIDDVTIIPAKMKAGD